MHCPLESGSGCDPIGSVFDVGGRPGSFSVRLPFVSSLSTILPISDMRFSSYFFAGPIAMWRAPGQLFDGNLPRFAVILARECPTDCTCEAECCAANDRRQRGPRKSVQGSRKVGHQIYRSVKQQSLNWRFAQRGRRCLENEVTEGARSSTLISRSARSR